MKRLPRGRHGLDPEFVARNQRERLMSALLECVHEVGYEKTTVAMIGERAHVSKSDFYVRFKNKDACFAGTYEHMVGLLRKRVLAAYGTEKDWPLRVRDALAALLGFLAADPARAQLLLVDGLCGGQEIFLLYEEALQSFGPCARSDAPGAPAGVESAEPSVGSAESGAGSAALIDEAIVGGVASMLGRRVHAGEAERLEVALPEVVEFALTPYLGADEARRISCQR